MPGIIQKLASFPGDVEPPGKPFKQSDAILIFDFGDHLAHGGLGNVQLPGSGTHAAGLGNGDEDFQMSEGHGRTLLCDI